MTTHTQDRRRTSDHPSRSSCSTVVRAATTPRSRGRSCTQERGRDEERRGVDREREARPDAQDERGGERRAGELGDRLDGAERGLRGLDLILRDGLRDEARVGRPEERLGGPEARLDQRDVPDLDRAGEDQDGEQRVQREADQVGGDHHLVPRQPVGPHAADQQERHQRHRVGGEHDADVGRRPQLGHVERQRDEHDPVADRARGLTAKQQPEVPVTEHALHDTP